MVVEMGMTSCVMCLDQRKKTCHVYCISPTMGILKAFIFGGYNAYFGGVKPSFFMVLGSKGMLYCKNCIEFVCYTPKFNIAAPEKWWLEDDPFLRSEGNCSGANFLLNFGGRYLEIIGTQRPNSFQYMDVSKNRGTPKFMVYKGKPY